jgi:tetratricopeptide (TPR) repeat protein
MGADATVFGMATKKAAPKSKPRPKKGSAAPKPVPSEKVASEPHPRDTLPFEIDTKSIEASLQKLKTEAQKWAAKGRYTKVRFKFRGKSLLPDIPLAALVAVEGLTFYWTGILRALVFNLAGRTVLEVELVNDSEKKLQAGKEALLSGDLDEALKAFRAAEGMDHDNPQVHLNLGVALKLKGDHDAARAALTKAKALDADGPTGAEAERLLGTLKAITVPPP